MNNEPILTASQLLAVALGEPLRNGAHLCFYCGASCDESFSTSKHVAESFTERNGVASPGSSFVCAGCVQAMRSDLGSVALIDGTEYRSKEGGKRKPREGASGVIQMRWFSWVLTERKAIAATPAHRQQLLGTCLSPPDVPFAICIADGNKHQLYRTPVNYSAERIAVNCEGVRVDYAPDELRERMELTVKLISVVGKGAGSLDRIYDDQSDMSVSLQLAKEFTDVESMYGTWRAVRHQPLSSLAIWLSPGKDEAHAIVTASR